jgi:hypothetical protein
MDVLCCEFVQDEGKDLQGMAFCWLVFMMPVVTMDPAICLPDSALIWQRPRHNIAATQSIMNTKLSSGRGRRSHMRGARIMTKGSTGGRSKDKKGGS